MRRQYHKKRNRPYLFRRATPHDYVFAYGSLMHDWLAEDHLIATVFGFKRDWDATMDNTKTIVGYKYYVDVRGSRNELPFVAFLNISKTKQPFEQVTGILKKVSLAELRELDNRERNYVRIDVTRLTQAFRFNGRARQRPHRIWTYTANDAARRRTRERERNHIAQVVPASYYRIFQRAVETLSLKRRFSVRFHFDVVEPERLAEVECVLVDR